MSLGIQPIHILVIIVVALLIFGPKKLPEMGRSIGKAISEFRQGTRDITDGISREINRPADMRPASSMPSIKPNLPGPATSVPVQPVSIAPGRSGNYCIQCGGQNPPEARYCNQCGTKLPEKVIPSSNPTGLSQ